MALFTTNSPEKAALDTLRGLHSNRGKLEAAIIEHETELAKLRAGSEEDSALEAFLQGAPAVDGEGFPTSARLRTSALEGKVIDLRQARTALCRRYRAGIMALGAVRAGEFRKQATKRQGELSKHRARTVELLAELERHTSCKYIVDLRAGADILVDGDGRESTFRRGGSRPAPKSFEYEAEIARLHASAQAAEDRAKRNCEGGQVSGETIEALLVVSADIERLAPTEAAVRGWFEQAAAKAEAEWAVTAAEYAGAYDTTARFRVAAPEHDVVFTLAWNPDGVIDTARSGAKNRPGRLTMPAPAAEEVQTARRG